MEFPVSDELKALLDRQTTLGTMAPTIKPPWMKWANDQIDAGVSIDDHSPSGVREGRPKTEPRPTLRIIRARPFLAMIDGGLQ